MLKSNLLLISWACFFVLLGISEFAAQSGNSFKQTSIIGRPLLVQNGIGPVTYIESFDLSPDGKVLALEADAGTHNGDPIFVLTINVATSRIINQVKIGTINFKVAAIISQVLFSSDQRYLVAEYGDSVKVMDSTTLKTVREFADATAVDMIPIAMVGAARADIFAFAFAAPVRPTWGMKKTPARIEVVDVSTGVTLSDWPADDAPQSISDDGKLIAISDWQTNGGILPVDIFTATGQKVRQLDGGFAFKAKMKPGDPGSRIEAAFVGNREIALTPDDDVDSSGSPSGRALQLVDAESGQIQQTLLPSEYGSLGILGTSANDGTLLAASDYIPPKYLIKSEGGPWPPPWKGWILDYERDRSGLKNSGA